MTWCERVLVTNTISPSRLFSAPLGPSCRAETPFVPELLVGKADLFSFPHISLDIEIHCWLGRSMVISEFSYGGRVLTRTSMPNVPRRIGRNISRKGVLIWKSSKPFTILFNILAFFHFLSLQNIWGLPPSSYGFLHRGADCTSQPLHWEGVRRRKTYFVVTCFMAVAVQHGSSGNQGSAKCLLVCSPYQTLIKPWSAP